MKKPTVEQIAKKLYDTMPLARREQVMEAAKAIHDLMGFSQRCAEYKKSKLEPYH